MGASILVAALSSAFGVLLIVGDAGTSARCCSADPYHRRQRDARRSSSASCTVLLTGRRDVRRGDRHRQHVLDDHRRAAPGSIALMRLIGAIGAVAARRGRAAGARRRRRSARSSGCVAGHRRRRRRSAIAARTARALDGRASPLVQPVLVAARRHRRAHDLGRGLGGVAARALGHAAAGARRLRRARRTTRSSRRTGRNIAAIALLRRPAGRCSARGVLVGLVTPLGVVVAFVGGIAVVHRARARRRRSSCRRCSASSAGCSVARPPRDSPPRTRCATRSARRAWRSAW